MTRGRFITLEGGEGVGKSTQARLLAEALAERGIAVALTREPGGTAGGEAIRSLLLDPAGPGWGIEAETLLFAAARADHVDQLIRPALERGEWVICDRFIDSTRAYQGGEGRISDEDILRLHRIGSGGILPDRTLLIELSPETAAERLLRRDGGSSDRIGGRDAAYHRGVANAFRLIAEAEPGRFALIDGEGATDEIHARIMRAVEPILESAA